MGEKKAFSTSEYMGRAITVYKENFLSLLNFSCAASFPLIFRMLLQASSDPDIVTLGMLVGPLVFCGYVFFFLCLVFAAASFVQGQLLGAKEVMAYVWSRFWRGVGAYLIFGVAVLGGVFLLVIPGVYCYTVLSFFSLAILLEDKGLWAAFKRSDDLVKGFFWPVLGANGIVVLATLVLFVPLILGMKMMGATDSVLFVLLGVVGAVIAPIFVIFYYFIYDFLKDEKDGRLNISVQGS